MRLMSIFRRKTEFMDFDAYKSKINFLETFYFQQATRKESMRNTHFF